MLLILILPSYLITGNTKTEKSLKSIGAIYEYSLDIWTLVT